MQERRHELSREATRISCWPRTQELVELYFFGQMDTDADLKGWLASASGDELKRLRGEVRTNGGYELSKALPDFLRTRDVNLADLSDLDKDSDLAHLMERVAEDYYWNIWKPKHPETYRER